MLYMQPRPAANWSTWSGSDPHSSTKPAWSACRLKTRRFYKDPF